MANVEHLLSIGHVLVLGPLEHQVLAVHLHGELAVGVLLDGAEGAEQPDDRAPLEIVSDRVLEHGPQRRTMPTCQVLVTHRCHPRPHALTYSSLRNASTVSPVSRTMPPIVYALTGFLPGTFGTAQPATSTSRTVVPRSRSSRAARYSRIASRMFSSASSSVAPLHQEPQNRPTIHTPLARQQQAAPFKTPRAAAGERMS